MTDETLVHQLKKGDIGAFQLLVDRHKNYAFTIANRIVNSTEEAEEIVQDAFFKVYRSAENFKGDSKFTTWFYRVVFNTAVSSKRKHRITTSTIDDAPIGAGGFEEQDQLGGSDRQQFIHQALNQLSDEDRLVLTLFYFKELTLEEMAVITSQDKSNLKVRLFRARKKLATQLTYLLNDEAVSL